MAVTAVSCRELDVIGVQRAMNIHITQVCGSCKEEACAEKLRLFPTKASQCAIDFADCIKDCRAELLYAYINAEPHESACGRYTVEVRFFYRVTAVAMTGSARPAEICGLTVFRKKVILAWNEGETKRFVLHSAITNPDKRNREGGLPSAVLEAAPPVVLDVTLTDLFDMAGDGSLTGVPPMICKVFGNNLFFGNEGRRVYITLRQNSTISLERDAQIVIRSKHQTSGGIQVR